MRNIVITNATNGTIPLESIIGPGNTMLGISGSNLRNTNLLQTFFSNNVLAISHPDDMLKIWSYKTLKRAKNIKIACVLASIYSICIPCYKIFANRKALSYKEFLRSLIQSFIPVILIVCVNAILAIRSGESIFVLKELLKMIFFLALLILFYLCFKWSRTEATRNDEYDPPQPPEEEYVSHFGSSDPPSYEETMNQSQNKTCSSSNGVGTNLETLGLFCRLFLFFFDSSSNPPMSTNNISLTILTTNNSSRRPTETSTNQTENNMNEESDFAED